VRVCVCGCVCVHECAHVSVLTLDIGRVLLRINKNAVDRAGALYCCYQKSNCPTTQCPVLPPDRRNKFRQTELLFEVQISTDRAFVQSTNFDRQSFCSRYKFRKTELLFEVQISTDRSFVRGTNFERQSFCSFSEAEEYGTEYQINSFSEQKWPSLRSSTSLLFHMQILSYTKP